MDGIGNFLGGLLGSIGVVLVPLFILIAFLAAMGAMAKYIKRVGTGKALIISGAGKPRVVTAGVDLVKPLIEMVQEISLEVMTIEVKADKVLASTMLELLIDWVAQIQVMPTPNGILTASRAFQGKSDDAIKRVLEQSLSGNFREVVAKLTPEEVQTDKDKFSQVIRNVASKEMEALGMTIIQVTIQKVTDEKGYFESLAAPKIAAAKRDATIAQAQAKRDATINEAEADQAAFLAQQAASQKKSEAAKDLAVKQAAYKIEADTQKAAADIAYDTKEAELKRLLAVNRGAVTIAEQEQAALAAEKMIVVAEKQAQANTVVPAQAQKEALILTAEGEKEKTLRTAEASAQATELEAKASASKISQTRTAEATGIEAVGRAEAAKTQAVLLAQADGESKLAEARAAQGQINLYLEVAKLLLQKNVDVAAELSKAIDGLGGNMKIIQFSGGDGQGGNPLLDTVMRIPEMAAVFNAKVEALGGKSVAEVLDQVMAILRSGGDLTAQSRHLGSIVTELQPTKKDES